MTDAEILDGLQAVAAAQLDRHEPLRPEQRIVEALDLDSLRMLTLVVELENHFRVYLDDEELVEVQTVAELVAALRRALEGAAPQSPSMVK